MAMKMMWSSVIMWSMIVTHRPARLPGWRNVTSDNRCHQVQMKSFAPTLHLTGQGNTCQFPSVWMITETKQKRENFFTSQLGTARANGEEDHLFEKPNSFLNILCGVSRCAEKLHWTCGLDSKLKGGCVSTLARSQGDGELPHTYAWHSVTVHCTFAVFCTIAHRHAYVSCLVRERSVVTKLCPVFNISARDTVSFMHSFPGWYQQPSYTNVTVDVLTKRLWLDHGGVFSPLRHFWGGTACFLLRLVVLPSFRLCGAAFLPSFGWRCLPRPLFWVCCRSPFLLDRAAWRRCLGQHQLPTLSQRAEGYLLLSVETNTQDKDCCCYSVGSRQWRRVEWTGESTKTRSLWTQCICLQSRGGSHKYSWRSFHTAWINERLELGHSS